MRGKGRPRCITPEQLEARIHRYLIGAFRNAWRWWSKGRKECIRVGKCITCGSSEEIVADHVNPVVDVEKGFEGWDTYAKRMFGGALQPLCGGCHKKKSKIEMAERARYRKIRKALQTKTGGV